MKRYKSIFSEEYSYSDFERTEFNPESFNTEPSDKVIDMWTTVMIEFEEAVETLIEKLKEEKIASKEELLQFLDENFDDGSTTTWPYYGLKELIEIEKCQTIEEIIQCLEKEKERNQDLEIGDEFFYNRYKTFGPSYSDFNKDY